MLKVFQKSLKLEPSQNLNCGRQILYARRYRHLSNNNRNQGFLESASDASMRTHDLLWPRTCGKSVEIDIVVEPTVKIWKNSFYLGSFHHFFVPNITSGTESFTLRRPAFPL